MRGLVVSVVTVAAFSLGCASYKSMEPAPMEERQEFADSLGAAPPPAAAAPMRGEGGAGGRMDGDLAKTVVAGLMAGEMDGKDEPAAAKAFDKNEKEKKGGADDNGGEGAPARSWFPEAFLWRPLVETGAAGSAVVDVTVPDALTTWRVLALAHDAAGRQAGAVHTFDGTLPLYVDPVVPGWLYAGDHVVLPVQAVNTTDAPVAATLEVRADGAMTGLGAAPVALGAGGTDVRTIPLDAVGAGEARITARLAAGAASDAAERVVPVLPAGRPVTTVRGGQLSASRTFRLPAPATADPKTEEIEVVVFPGPLAVLGAELERLRGGARPEDGAYGLALASAVQSLSATANVPVDDAALRRLRLQSWQRVVYESMAPDAGQAADLLLSLRSADEFPQVHEVLPRLVRTVVGGQRADGTWSRTATGTLQGVLVQTGAAAKVLPEGEAGARLRASAAVERYAHEIKDPFTAAVVVGAGLATGSLAEELRKRIREGLVDDPVLGTKLVLPPGVVDPWGLRPTPAEAMAWVVLALPADAPERGDLAAQLLQSWSATWGFGAGRADALALEAVRSALPGTSEPIELCLDLDGVRGAVGKLDPTQPKLPVTLSAHPATADPEIALTAGGATVPGLAFVATRRSWVPWTDADRVPGVQVQAATGPLSVGVEGTLDLSVAAPSGAVVRLEQGLPAGALVGDGAGALAVMAGARLEVFPDRIVVTSRPFQAGEVLELKLPVTPAFAGHFQTGPTLLSVDGAEPVPTKPIVWTVGAGKGS